MDTIHELTDAAFEAFLQNAAGDAGAPSEENMALILSNAMRADDPALKAQLYVDLANMAMSLADTTLGSKGRVVRTLDLKLH